MWWEARQSILITWNNNHKLQLSDLNRRRTQCNREAEDHDFGSPLEQKNIPSLSG